jgi:hypothetical protein
MTCWTERLADGWYSFEGYKSGSWSICLNPGPRPFRYRWMAKLWCWIA